MGLQMNEEYLWNDADNVKAKYSEKNLNHRHFVHPKSNVDWRGIEPDPPQWQDEDQSPEPMHDPSYVIRAMDSGPINNRGTKRRRGITPHSKKFRNVRIT